jgi:hypothetical protein
MESEERMLKPNAVPHIKIVAGNKCDLANSRAVSSAEGLEWARNHDCGFMETSARNVVNIEETFECKCNCGGRGGEDAAERALCCTRDAEAGASWALRLRYAWHRRASPGI